MNLLEPADEPRLALASQPALRIYVLLLFLQVTAASAVQILSIPFGLAFSEVFFFLAPVTLWALGANYRPASLLKLRRPEPGAVLLGVAIGLANFLPAGTIQVLTRKLLPADVVRQFDISHLFEGAPGLELAFILASVALFAPVCEEIAFRGYLQTVFGARYRPAVAIAATSVLFAALHFDPVGFLSRVELGVLFGVLTLWSGSVWPAVAAHLANNAVASALFVAAGRLGQDPAAQEDPDLLPTLAWASLAALVTAGLLLAFRSRARRPAELPEELNAGEGHAFSLARASRAGLAWAGAAGLSLLLFFAFQGRSAALNWADFSVPLAPRLEALDDPAGRKALEDRLRAAKRSAREGQGDVAAYESLRREVAQALEGDAGLRARRIEEAFERFEKGPRPEGEGPSPVP